MHFRNTSNTCMFLALTLYPSCCRIGIGNLVKDTLYPTSSKIFEVWKSNPLLSRYGQGSALLWKWSYFIKKHSLRLIFVNNNNNYIKKYINERKINIIPQSPETISGQLLYCDKLILLLDHFTYRYLDLFICTYTKTGNGIV